MDATSADARPGARVIRDTSRPHCTGQLLGGDRFMRVELRYGLVWICVLPPTQATTESQGHFLVRSEVEHRC